LVDTEISLSKTGVGVSSGKEIDEEIKRSKKTAISAGIVEKRKGRRLFGLHS
jgi:hypothetical protein